ncbi:hypothetical protein BDY24DRAFT_228709 [Mrakia frigida]|uniref:uncharacterized protein n=1 Tax=Mrakia frigida TaxID=29902 RepID=UPI003FCC18F9
MSILPSQYEGAPTKPRQRMAIPRSLSPNMKPGFVRTSSSSSSIKASATSPASLAPPDDADHPSLFRPGTPFSPSTSDSYNPDLQDIDIDQAAPPSPDRVPKVIPFVPSKGSRRRSNTVETGGRGGWSGWKERQWKVLAKRGWTKAALAWRMGALFLLGLFFLSGKIKKSWEDAEAATIQEGKGSSSKHAVPLHQQKWAAKEEEQPEELLDHEFSPDGFLRSSLSLTQRHPIWELIDQATEQYDLLVQSQALSLGNFVDHYKKLNGRKPPLRSSFLPLPPSRTRRPSSTDSSSSFPSDFDLLYVLPPYQHYQFCTKAVLPSSKTRC